MKHAPKPFTQIVAALVLSALFSVSAISGEAQALQAGIISGDTQEVQATEEIQTAQNFGRNRSMELNSQRIPLETVISRIQSQCGGRLINARHDAATNMYIIRWETARHRIVSMQIDASNGQIVSGGC